MPTRVLIVDDVEDLRALLVYVLVRKAEGQFEIVGEAGDGEAAIRLAQDLQPDVILLDISMPIMDGLEALPHIRRASPMSRVVICSGFEAGRLASTAFEMGAVAYIEKGAPPQKLVEEVRRAASAAAPPLFGGGPRDEDRAPAGVRQRDPRFQALAV